MGTAKNKQSFNTAVARRALIYSFCLIAEFVVQTASPGCSCVSSDVLFSPPNRRRTSSLLLFTHYQTGQTCAHLQAIVASPPAIQKLTLFIPHLPSSGRPLQDVTGEIFSILFCPFNAFILSALDQLLFFPPAHTEVTVLTLADSACLKRLFRSCMLGDFGLGMRGERLFSVAPLAEV